MNSSGVVEPVRSFIAIELPDGLKIELRQLIARLKSANQPWVKWVDPDGIHLTLKFLGNVAADKIESVIRAMEEAARDVSPFQLKVGGLGVFPNLRQVRVVWVGTTGDVDKLTRLQQNIEAYVAPLGFPTESRSFSAHLTLARLREPVDIEERQEFGNLIASTKFEATSTIEVKTISLMRSQLTRAGAIYSCIASVKLR